MSNDWIKALKALIAIILAILEQWGDPPEKKEGVI